MVRGRYFLVGCPRSGTTLLQACLAAHPQVASFPETHFFNKAFPRNRLRRALGWPSLQAWRYMGCWARLIGRPELARLNDVWPWTPDYARGFRRILDHLAEEQGCELWLEKTPEHVYRMEQIARAVPGARFLHLVRRGQDAVASFYKVSGENPTIWGGLTRHLYGHGLSLAECVDRWNASVRLMLARRGDPDHHVVRYEDLVADPAGTLQAVCAFMGLPYDAAMLDRERSARQVVLPFEEWKAGAARPIAPPVDRFRTMLTPEEQAFVERRLEPLPW